MVLCARPLHLAREEADRWLCRQLTEVLAEDEVAGIRLTSLSSASMAWARPCDYLIEIDLRPGAEPGALVRGAVCAGVFGDLRLLGMRPAVLVVDDRRAVAVAAERR